MTDRVSHKDTYHFDILFSWIWGKSSGCRGFGFYQWELQWLAAPGLDPPEGGRNARKPLSMTKPIDIHTDKFLIATQNYGRDVHVRFSNLAGFTEV